MATTNGATVEQQFPVGIDLGTTYSVVAYVDASGRPVTVPNDAGDLLTPSALLFEDGEIVVGKEAAKSSAITPFAYADCFKRDMGGSAFRRKVRGHQLPPEVLSGFVLQRLKQDAERRIGSVRQVVITVPAFFDETRRKATQDAGRLAGLEVLDIINEPTAAAVAYGYQQGFLRLAGGEMAAERRRVLVYDLGGGTFDVTILEMEGRQFRALATDGDVQLGGKDFDERLVDYIAEQFLATHGVDPRTDAEDAAQLWLDAQEVKHTLSQRTRASVVCFHAGLRLKLEISREQFEELTQDLVGRSETTTSLLLKQAALTWDDIDRVLLVGGSSRIPMVVEMLRRLTGKEPDQSLSPDEAVAHGAALYAGMLMQEQSGKTKDNYRLVNVNSHSLGVVGVDPLTRRKTNVILIPRNTPLPHQVVRRCKTARAGQRSVVVSVVEGESRRPDECIPLGQCVIRNLPPDMPAGAPIQVEYRYMANGRIAVSARLPGTRQSAHVEIRREQSQDLKDLATWRKLLLDEAEPAADSSPAHAPPQSAGGHERLQRLDELYIQVGRVALDQVLPESLTACRKSALEADLRLQAAEQQLAAAEKRKGAAASPSESIQLSGQVAQAQVNVNHARAQAEFTLLVLGRQCANGNVTPRGAEAQLNKIRQLRAG